MNTFIDNLQEKFDFWKQLYHIQSNEVLTMKEKNDYLNKKVDMLEEVITSFGQIVITKEEMKNILNDKLSPIMDILIKIDKRMIDVETQTNNRIMQEKKEEKLQKAKQKGKKIVEQHIKNINKIEEIMQSEHLDNNGICSLTESEYNRIITGGADGNISISSYDIEEKKWNKDIYKEKAHNGWVTSLCTANDNRLISSGKDFIIKIWKIFDTEISLLKEIKGHTKTINKVILLSKERFASCSDDKTVQIWKDDKKNKQISMFKHEGPVSTILQLKGKEVLVSCVSDSSIGLAFWNLKKSFKQRIIKGYCVNWSTHMIELPDGNIAISANDEPFPIVIIDCLLYQVKKEIYLKEYINSPSSLYVFNQSSFIYVGFGSFLQISSTGDHSILYKSTDGDFKGYFGGVISIEEGLLAIQNDKSVSIVKVYGT